MKLKQYLNESSNKEKLFKKLNQWKKDLRRMTKLYKSLKAEDSPQAIKKFMEVQKHWVMFHKNWEKWYMQELIKSSTDKDETYYREQVRIMAWRAEMSVNNLLPTQYDSKTGSHVSPAPWLLDNPRYSKGDTRKNKILVYQKAFKKAFDAIEDLINYEADDVNMIKDTEQISIAGINVLISGKKEKDDKWTEKVTKQFIQVLPTAVQLIKKSGLDLPLKGLTIEVTLSGAKSVGVQSGAGGSYNYSRDWLRMYPMGIGSKNDGIKTFIHELGHRYYYKNLKERVRNAWDRAIQKRQVEVKEHHVDEFFAKYVGDIDEKFNKKATEASIKKNEKDPSLKRIYTHLVHNFPRWYVDDEDKRTNYIRKMKEYYTEWIDLEFVTDYAATKPNEAFAEVFAHWVIKRNTLGEWTRSFFKEIVRSGGANIREEKNLIDKYLTENVSSQEADEFMNRWKTKLKTYGITHVESSIHFKDQINNKRNVPPIAIKELDFVLDGFFKKFGTQFRKDIENVKNHTAKRRGVNKKQLKENEYEFTVKSRSTFVNLVFVLKQDRFKKGTAMILPMTIMRKKKFGTLKGDEVIVERRLSWI